MILVVVGLQGSGKGVVGDILRKRGFTVIELGDIWRELIAKAGIPITDVHATREFTLQIRLKEGKDVYARYAIQRIDKSMKKVAIMGVRSTYETDYLQKYGGGIEVIEIRAPFETRFKRMKKRAKPEDPKTLEDFKWLETRTLRGFMADKSEEKYGLRTVMTNANYRLMNTGTTKQLEKGVDEILEGLDYDN